MSRKKSGPDGTGSGERVIAGAIGLAAGFIILWVFVIYAWEAIWK